MAEGFAGKTFHWADYLLFGISFSATIIIGLIFAVKDKWLKQTSESYLMANRNMNFFMVGVSWTATSLSALMFIGVSAEFYYLGMTATWVGLSFYIGALLVAIFIIPKYHRLGFKITSAYEYFQYRFNLPVRLLVAFFYFTLTILYLAVALYIPSIFLAQVSVLNIYWSIFLGAIVCLMYTAFGGMRAVIWVDNIQAVIMAAGMLTLIIKGSIDAGGMSEVWRKYSEIGERDNWDDKKTQPWDRYNVWNTIFLFAIFNTAEFGTDQTLLQRYMTVRDMRSSQGALLIGVTLAVGFLAMVIILAMVMFAVVGGNEPLLNGQTETLNQILPYFMMYVLGDYHGVPGLVTAALFAAALSTLSSGQTALAAVFLEDFVKPLHKICSGKLLTKKAAGIISRVAGVAIGVIIMATALAVPNFSDTLLKMALSIQSFTLGPFLGLMICGFWCFWIESWGAFVGLLSGVGWAVMMYFGNLFLGQKIGNEQAPLFMANYSVVIRFDDPADITPTLWDVSYTWYTFLDCCVVIVVGTLVSLSVHVISYCVKKGYTIKSTMPSKEFRYTIDDFLVAVGCRKNEYEKELEEPDSIENSVKPQEDGEENEAYENSTNL